LQVKPQLVPSQVAVALGGALHGVQEDPQLFTESCGTQASPQR